MERVKEVLGMALWKRVCVNIGFFFFFFFFSNISFVAPVLN